MAFRFYFLKENTRIYDKSELITYFQSNPYITAEKILDNRVFTYHHAILNFEAKFVMSGISVVPKLERLDPRFYDVNLYVEFDIKLPTYCVEMILDITDEIAKKFKFFVYNEAFSGVLQFKRSFMIKTFEAWKKAYASKNEEEISKFNRLDPQTLQQVYNYLLRRPKLEILFDKDKITISNYFFMYAEKSRSAFVGISWNGEKAFILPPSVDILYFEPNQQYYSMSEVITKGEKLFKPIDGFGVIQQLEQKNVKKLVKLLVRDTFTPTTVALKELSMDKILDI